MSALVATPNLYAQEWNCADSGNLPQQGMNYCAGVDFKKADTALNQAWKFVFSQIKDRDTTQIEQWKGWPDAVLKAQRAWIEFRDTNCATEAFKYRGGSIEPLIYQTCRTDMTEKRIQQLKSLLDE
ncbi:MAG: lysozyme inhibitor LprI family protein [Rhizobiaceae bacterium]